jgi:hypothetical protein
MLLFFFVENIFSSSCCQTVSMRGAVPSTSIVTISLSSCTAQLPLRLCLGSKYCGPNGSGRREAKTIRIIFFFLRLAMLGREASLVENDAWSHCWDDEDEDFSEETLEFCPICRVTPFGLCKICCLILPVLSDCTFRGANDKHTHTCHRV